MEQMKKMENMDSETLTMNVAPKSSVGHFVKGTKTVVLDQVNEMFVTEGPSELVTKNHTTISVPHRTFIAPQQVVDPASQVRQRSMD